MVNYKRFKERLKAVDDDHSTYYDFLSSARDYITWVSRLAGPEVGKRKSDIYDQAAAKYKTLENIVEKINKDRKFRIPTKPDLLSRFAEEIVNYTKNDIIIEKIVHGKNPTKSHTRGQIMH